MSDKQYTHQHDQTHLESALRKAKPWFDANATFLIYGLAAVLAVAAGVVWLQRQPDENSSASALFMDASEPEDFQSIADENQGTALGTLARLKQAETLLNSASRNMFTDRKAANLELEQAEAALNRLSDVSGLDSSTQERVLMNQARLLELRCDGSEGSVNQVVEAWQAVISHNESSMAKDFIERRIERLQQPGAGDFYAWFHDLDPKTVDDLNFPGLSNMPTGPSSSVPAIPGGSADDSSSLNLPTFDFSDTELDSNEKKPGDESTDGATIDQADGDTSDVGTDEPEASSDSAGESAGDSTADSVTEESAAEPEADAGE